MDLSRGNEKTIGVFVFGSETKQLCWIPKETISGENGPNGIKDKSYNFQGERNFISF